MSDLAKGKDKLEKIMQVNLCGKQLILKSSGVVSAAVAELV